MNNTPITQNETGRPAILDDKLIKDIGALVIADKNYTEIANILGIDYGTMMNWRYSNYNGFYEKMMLFEAQKNLIKAEQVIKEIINMDTLTKNGEQSSRLLKIKADMATFLMETVGKQVYSKRTEQTGANGEAMQVNVVKYELPVNEPVKDIDYKVE